MKNQESHENDRFLRTLVEYPEETAEVDYKAAVKFDSKSEFGAKLVKHTMGFVNAGGGYIVIGFIEDVSKKLQPDPTLDEDVARSYEITSLSQSVDSYLRAGQRIDLQVHKVEHQGRIYPILSINGFTETPFFCGKDFLDQNRKPILKEGAIYIRDRAAKTTVMAGPGEWNQLLKIAVRQRQNEVIKEMRSLFEQMGLGTPPGRPDVQTIVNQQIENWLVQEGAEVKKLMAEGNIADVGFLEVVHFPQNIDRMWNQAELLEAAQKAMCQNTDWPLGIVLRPPEFAPQPFEWGIRVALSPTDYWSLERHGTFYLVRGFEEDLEGNQAKRRLWSDTRIWKVAEVFLHCSKLYLSLGLPADTELVVRVSHHHLKDRLLGARNPLRAFMFERRCGVDRVPWAKIIPLGTLETDLITFVKDVLGEVFILFDFWKPEEKVWESIFNEFLRSRV